MRVLPWLHPVMGASWLAYVVLGLLPVPVASAPPLDWALPALVVLGAAVALVGAERRGLGSRPWSTPTGLGLCVLLVSLTVEAVQHWTGTPSPPWLTLLGLAAYPLLVIGLLLALRPHLRALTAPVAVDGAGATLAGAALAACAVAPTLWGAPDRSPLGGLVGFAASLGDVALVAACFGALAVVATGVRWPLLGYAVGLGLLGAGNLVAAQQQAAGAALTWGDQVAVTGIALLAVGATALEAPGAKVRVAESSLPVVALSSVSGVVALVAAPDWSVTALPSMLALLALGVCGVRFLLLLVVLRELGDVRLQAFSDELTGAANRRALHAGLDERAADAGTGFALALVDLDHFKEVNDSYGHGVGDELLTEVVRRFGAVLEELATPHLLARLGGDEFAVLLSEVDSCEAAVLCAQALQDSLVEPVTLDRVVLRIQASIGLALAPEHGRNRGDLLFAADAAMYVAKSSGGGVHVHAPDHEGGARRGRLEVAQDLYAALDNGELTVEYQPIMTPAGGLVGAEALVRWDHPTRGRLTPAEFLDIAERHRLTSSITQRVLDVALSDLHRWLATGEPLRTSINVSASDLRDVGLVDVVAAGLLRHDVPPSALTVEITETEMMQDPDKARTVMQALCDLGVQLSVDDYGTGYSSLEYLLNLPIDEIKLDRAFCTDLPMDCRAGAIVRSTVELTHALGLRMVAEGVETSEALATLGRLGCDLVQGWHLGRPMPAADFESLLAHRLPDEPGAGRLRRSTELSA